MGALLDSPAVRAYFLRVIRREKTLQSIKLALFYMLQSEKRVVITLIPCFQNWNVNGRFGNEIQKFVPPKLSKL